MANIGKNINKMVRRSLPDTEEEQNLDQTSKSNSFRSSEASDESDVQMKGWMRKQKETLRSWPRRYFTLAGNILAYYDSEDISRGPRGIIEFIDVTALTTEDNGLLLHQASGKETRLIADTHVAFSAWMAVLSAALKKPATDKKHSCKDGWAHILVDDDIWTRYFIVVKNDSFSCYESEDEGSELALSGLVRSVCTWGEKRFGLIVGLSKGRKIKLCFDNTEEKMSWLLSLEFAASYGSLRIKRELKKKAASNSEKKIIKKASSSVSATNKVDNGVWI